MKHKCFAAVVLAAALLLTGCGGAAAPAAPAGSGAASQSAAAVQTAQKERITDQWSLEKTVRGEMIGVMKLSIHVPQLVCDSPDAAALNEELAAMYVAEYKDYESDPDAEVPQGEECSQTEINWDAYWYGDCVSLVMRSHDYDDAPWYYSGWCFDFATGRRITTAEMLQHMGLDPDEVQAQVQRQAMQAFDREMAQGAYYEGLRSGGNLSEMRMGTLEYNELENLCLLLPEQDRLVLRGKYCSETDWGWQQLDVEIPLTPAAPADTPVLTDTYDGVQVQLKGTQATITLSPAPMTDQWGDIGIRVEQTRTYPILGAYNEYVDVCIGEQEDGFFRPVVYLLTKDGVVEYVDVLRCLLFGDATAMICQDPIYFANNGTALELCGSEVNLHRKDGSVLELAGSGQRRQRSAGRAGQQPHLSGRRRVSGRGARGRGAGHLCRRGRNRADVHRVCGGVQAGPVLRDPERYHDRRAEPLCRGRDPAADDPQLRLRTQENDYETQTPCRCGAGGGSLADRLRRCGGSRCPRKLRHSCPKRRRHGGADSTKRPHHRAVHAGKDHPERVRHHL